MSDARLVTVHPFGAGQQILDKPNGTHLLVPVGWIDTFKLAGGYSAYMADLYADVVKCPACGGSGMKMSKMPTAKWPESTVESDCPACNGRGWVIAEEGDDGTN